jgi:phospholipid transport system transporter-binding protein
VNQNQAEITQQNQQQYTISGAIDFNTAPDLLQRASGFFKEEKTSESKIKIDLSKITECNSAGLALMFEMVKHARTKNIDLHFENLPDTLLIIAKAYGVEAEVKSISE